MSIATEMLQGFPTRRWARRPGSVGASRLILCVTLPFLAALFALVVTTAFTERQRAALIPIIGIWLACGGIAWYAYRRGHAEDSNRLVLAAAMRDLETKVRERTEAARSKPSLAAREGADTAHPYATPSGAHP